LNWIEAAGFVITVASIWLATRENVWYYPTGIVSVLLYGWIYYDAKLYAESALQLVWLALMLYGWYQWLYGGADRRELPITRTPRGVYWFVAAAGVALTAIIVVMQRRYTDNPVPFVDSTITAFSILAQWMTARKYLENWLLWIAINIIAVPLYITRELWFTAALYAILLIVGIDGYRKWRRTLTHRS
jgi:nicotinamide mononucleotide transporter